MFGLSFWEIAIILGIALIVLGPKKLPELARSLGKGIREFRRATDDFKSSVESGMSEDDEPRKQLATPAEVEPIEAQRDQAKAAEAEAAAVAQVEEAQRAAAADAPKSELPEAEPPPWDQTEAKSEG